MASEEVRDKAIAQAVDFLSRKGLSPDRAKKRAVEDVRDAIQTVESRVRVPYEITPRKTQVERSLFYLESVGVSKEVAQEIIDPLFE